MHARALAEQDNRQFVRGYRHGVLRVLATLMLLGATLPACLVAEWETTPFGRLPLAVVRGPVVQPGPVAIAACPLLVMYDGQHYTPDVGAVDWDIPAGALTDIGVATGSNFPMPDDERRVYALDGVRSGQAIAMRLSARDGVTVLLPVDTSLGRELCPYISADDQPPMCDDPADQPDPTKASDAP